MSSVQDPHLQYGLPPMGHAGMKRSAEGEEEKRSLSRSRRSRRRTRCRRRSRSRSFRRGLWREENDADPLPSPGAGLDMMEPPSSDEDSTEQKPLIHSPHHDQYEDHDG